MTQIDEPNIDDKIREMLFSWHKWRDYYYSDLKEQVITDDEWKVTRDKIDDDAIKAIKALIATQIQEARINELKNLLADDGQCICQLANQEVCDHNWSLCNTVKDRIAQLRSTPNEDMDN